MTEFDREYFDSKFEDAEWGFFESEYEQRKYERTLRRGFERQPYPDSILELATGPGAFVEKILNQYPQADFTGVDISGVALEKAREVANSSQNPERAELLQDDMVDFASENSEEFDLVFMSESVYYPAENETQEDFRQFSNNLADLIAEDGHLISANIHRDIEEDNYKKNDKIRMEKIRRELEAGGLDTLETAFFPDEPKTYGEKGYREHDYAIWVMTPSNRQTQNNHM